MYSRGDTVFIYKYTNKINGKIYIGLTTRTVEIRHKEHLKDINNGSYFHRVMKKYGINNFKLETLCECNNFEELKEAEKFYIKKFNSFANANKSNGYNLTMGGEGTIGFNHSDKTRLGLSVAKIEFYKHNIHPAFGVNKTEENKEKQRKIMSDGRYDGEKNPYYGKKHSKEIRSVMSEKAKTRCAEGRHNWKGNKHTEESKRLIGSYHKGKTISRKQRENQSKMFSGEKNPSALKVLCTTTGEIFNYMGEASIKYGIDRSNLTKCCKGKTKWCGIHPETKEKLNWSYYKPSIL